MTVNSVLSGAKSHHVECAHAEVFLDSLPDGCASLMPLDFPYYGVKDDPWDNAWPTPEAFIEWMGSILAKCRRVLAPNGSIYIFAAPQVRGGLTMATRVEVEVARHFSLLQRITWRKPPGSTKAEMFDKDSCRIFFPASEVVLFAEQHGADDLYDSNVRDEHAPYFAACEATKREVFGDYIAAEITRAGVSKRGIQELFPSRTGGLTGCVSNWLLGLNSPTRQQYDAIRSRLGHGFLVAEYATLAEKYDDAKRQHQTARASLDVVRQRHEQLRRPFTISPDVPYTDVWTYATVNTYPGKHPCEKPDDMARDIVSASSRSGDLVVDCFCGSGKFLAAAVAQGRRAVGCDADAHWAEASARRCDATKVMGRIPRTPPPKKTSGQMPLPGL